VPPDPPLEERNRAEEAFFDNFLRADHPQPIASNVRYYTMGEGVWHVTAVWPPSGFSVRRYYLASAPNSVPAGDGNRSIFGKECSLDLRPPAAVSASDSYTIMAGVRVVEAPREIKSFPYFMAWHPRLTHEPAHEWFREQLRSAVRTV
jgi:DNA-binding transcriptional LysR family regulator